MEISSLTLLITEKCNFRCRYCYQEKESSSVQTMNMDLVDKASEFFFPFFNDKCYVNFFGGEPLLAFDLIKHAINRFETLNHSGDKKITYSFTTNGSLFTDEITEFLIRHQVQFLISFDGLAQDISRQPGSFVPISELIKKLLRNPKINFEVNSVFTPETVLYLNQSMQFLCELGVKNIDFNLNIIEPWDKDAVDQFDHQLQRLRLYLVQYYRQHGNPPVVPFRNVDDSGIFRCAAGLDRMTLGPEGTIWGVPPAP